MNLVTPFDSVVITLNENDEQKLKDLIKLQKDCDKNNKKFPARKNMEKICGIAWSKLK